MLAAGQRRWQVSASGVAMSLPARLFGADGEDIADLDSWLFHSPPEKGLAHWKDGFSAKEHAKSWLRSRRPRMPDELWSALSALDADANEVDGRPEHTTQLDSFSRGHQHDLVACLQRDGAMTTAIGIEAKGCERFDGKYVIALPLRRRVTSARGATS
jgi:hypothetical protein